MENTYKRVQFDLKLAKKILSGEIEGRIVTNGDFNIRILCLDRDYMDCPIVALVKINKCEEQVISYNTNGATNNPYFNGCRQLLHLCIELPEEPLKYEFKPFDKVLCRDMMEEEWKACLFSHEKHGTEYSYYMCGGSFYKQCIPYEGNEHLLGTTKSC